MGLHVLRRGVNIEAVCFVEVIEGLHFPGRSETSTGKPPACSTAPQGLVSSTCSTPSLATKNATRLPVSSWAMAHLQFGPFALARLPVGLSVTPARPLGPARPLRRETTVVLQDSDGVDG